MRSGLLKDIIIIERAEIVKNAYGEDVEQWHEVQTTRADIRQTNSSRTTTNDEIFYDFTKEMIVRYYVNVQQYDRIKYDGNTYRIISIDKDRNLQLIRLTTQLINE